MSAPHLAFIIDPIDDLKVYKDSTVVMMAAAAARGCRLSYAGQGWISLEGGRVIGRFVEIELTGVKLDGHSGPWYREVATRTEPLSFFDAVLMRKDPPFDQEYLYSTYLLERAAQQGARVVNESVTGFSSHRHNPGFLLSETDAQEDAGRVWGFNLLYSGNHYAAAQRSAQGIAMIPPCPGP